MSGPTSIAWTDATWNPVRGCTRVSEGCRHCYAETLAARNLPGHRSPTTGKPFAVRTTHGPRWTGKVELVPHLLDWPLRWRGDKQALAEGRPSRIFVNSMSDLFHEALPDGSIDQVFAMMNAAPQHTFQVLTKRPERLVQYMRGLEKASAFFVEMWPLPNVWLGVSVENQETADARVPLLLKTPAALRFVSYEPALGPVDFRWGGMSLPDYAPQRPLPRLDWVIVGGESGPGARPFDVAWARSTVEQCKAAGVACFVKQLGARAYGPDVHSAILTDRKGGDPSEWPADLRVQDFPRP